MLTALSQLRVINHTQSREVETVHNGEQIIDLLPGPTTCSIKVGTSESDAVTLKLSESDYDALMNLVGQLDPASAGVSR